MKCYYHPTEEAVANCAKCGVGLCRSCENNAYMREGDGTGRALCPRCSLNAAQSAVDYESSWLKKRIVKLVICWAITLFGIISYETGGQLINMFVAFFFAGVIANFGETKKPQSVKSQVYDAYMDAKNPIMSTVIDIIIYTIAGPIWLIALTIGYLRTKKQYSADLAFLDKIKASMGV